MFGHCEGVCFIIVIIIDYNNVINNNEKKTFDPTQYNRKYERSSDFYEAMIFSSGI